MVGKGGRVHYIERRNDRLCISQNDDKTISAVRVSDHLCLENNNVICVISLVKNKEIDANLTAETGGGCPCAQLVELFEKEAINR